MLPKQLVLLKHLAFEKMSFIYSCRCVGLQNVILRGPPVQVDLDWMVDGGLAVNPVLTAHGAGINPPLLG